MTRAQFASQHHVALGLATKSPSELSHFDAAAYIVAGNVGCRMSAVDAHGALPCDAVYNHGATSDVEHDPCRSASATVSRVDSGRAQGAITARVDATREQRDVPPGPGGRQRTAEFAVGSSGNSPRRSSDALELRLFLHVGELCLSSALPSCSDGDTQIRLLQAFYPLCLRLGRCTVPPMLV